MKSKIKKNQILMKGIALTGAMLILMSSTVLATDVSTVSDSVSQVINTLMYGIAGLSKEEIKEQFNNTTIIYITNEAQLRALAEYVNEGNDCSGKIINLSNDITVDKAIEWTPIGRTNSNAFNGTFDGKGYTISGIRVSKENKNNSDMTNIGLFGYNKGTIKNVNITDTKYELNYELNSEITSSSEDIIEGTQITEYYNLGGISGVNTGLVENCNVISTESSSVEISGLKMVGGIVGNNTGTINKCTNNATVQGFAVVGGISGNNKGGEEQYYTYPGDLKHNYSTTAKVLNSSNSGHIYALYQNVGGIVGINYKDSIVQKCYNEGKVSLGAEKFTIYISGQATTVGPENAGGIAGWVSGGKTKEDKLISSTIDGCINIAVVEGYKDVGGLVGQLGGDKGGYGLLKSSINYNTNIKTTVAYEETYFKPIINSQGLLVGSAGVKNAEGGGILYKNFFTIDENYMKNITDDQYAEIEFYLKKLKSSLSSLIKESVGQAIETRVIELIPSYGDDENKEFLDYEVELLLDRYTATQEYQNIVNTYIDYYKTRNTNGIDNLVNAVESSIENFSCEPDNQLTVDGFSGCNFDKYKSALEADVTTTMNTYNAESYKVDGWNTGSTDENKTKYCNVAVYLKARHTATGDGIGEDNSASQTNNGENVIIKYNNEYYCVAGTSNYESDWFTAFYPYKIIAMKDIDLENYGNSYSYNRNGKEIYDVSLGFRPLLTNKESNALYLTGTPSVPYSPYDPYNSYYMNVSSSEDINLKYNEELGRWHVNYTNEEVSNKIESALYKTNENGYITKNIASLKYTIIDGNGNDIESGTYINSGKIKVKVEVDKALYTGLNQGEKIYISQETAPSLTMDMISRDERSVDKKLTISEVVNKSESTVIIYEYDVSEPIEVQVKDLKLCFDNAEEYYYSDDGEVDSEYSITKGTEDTINLVDRKYELYIDSIVPTVITEAYVEEKNSTNMYSVGKEILIKAVTSEAIDTEYEIPEIKVSFSKSGTGLYNNSGLEEGLGNAKHTGAVINADGTTTWYFKYIVQNGDDGELELEYVKGKVIDLAKNETTLIDLNSQEGMLNTNDIKVDTALPTVEITAKKVNEDDTTTDITNYITDANTIRYTFKWSEEVYGFTADDITVNNGVKGELKQSETNKTLYTMDVTTSTNKGSVGEIQVIVEADKCQDILNQGNVRSENIITIDKQAPIFEAMQAYTTSDISISKDITKVKEYYKAGDMVTIEAIFNETIVANSIPSLVLQFSESGEAKGEFYTGTPTITSNKIVYVYIITDDDIGTLSIKGFSGLVSDVAGNTINVAKINLNGNTIIADTDAPTLKELNVKDPSTGTYKAGESITVEAIYDEEVYILENNQIKNITSSNAPTLKVKFGDGTEREVSAVGYGAKEDGSVDRTKVIYTCEVEDGDTGVFTITSYENKENVKVCDIAGNEAALGKNQTGNEITADTTRPKVENMTASVEYPSISNTGIYYKVGNSIKIVLTFNEPVSGAVLWPKIQVGFSEIEGQEPETYNDYAYESDWNVNSTTIEYSYTVKDGDNGYLWVKVPENQFADIAGNQNIAKEATRLSNIYADTTKPTVTLLRDTAVEQNNQTITIKAEFSEDVYDLKNNSRVDLTTANAPKLIYSFGTGENKEISPSSISGATIKYTITKDPVNDNGTLRYELAKGNLCDRAGNLYYEETTDTTAPELEEVYITNDSDYGVYCKKGVNIYVTAVFNEEIASQNMKLKVKLGEGQEKELTGKVNDEDKTEVVFKYTVEENDNGKLTILDVLGNTSTDESLEDKTYGYVKDAYGNTKNIFNFTGITIEGEAIADTIAPTLAITSDVERTNKDIVKYTFTWSETVTDFDEDDIELINGLKGNFKAVPNTNGKVYTLEVETIEEGRQIVKVNAGVCVDVAGNENNQRFTYNKVVIDYTKPVIRAKVNGGSYVMDTTDPENKKAMIAETLVVNEELSELKYAWSTETDIEKVPEIAWITEDVEAIFVNSDITLNKELKETGTYYLYMKATDLAGNILNARTKAFVVSNSKITLTPDITDITNKDVTVSVEYGEGLTENRKAGVSGKTQSADASKVIITENGTVYAEATDKAGNKVCKVLEIENIDKIAPEGTITYVTNEDKSVTATINFNEENVTITNNNAENTYVFEENGEFTFEFKDLAGNTGTAKAVVTTIDKTPPEATINYITNADGSITAKISFNEETVITNNGGKDTYVFTKNGEFTFEFKDLAGNIGSAVAKVTSIKDTTDPEKPPVEEDKTAPTITFNYTTTTATVGTPIGATISTDEDAIISYSWDNKTWTTSQGYVRTQSANRTPSAAGTYTLYAKAVDKSSNQSTVQKLEFTVVNSEEDIKRPEIIFEDLPTMQVNGVKYVKVSSEMTTGNLTDKMDKNALCDATPKYTKLTSDNKLRTSSEITINGETKYVIIVNGDVNCDGKVSFLGDIVMINNYRIGLNKNLSTIQILAADVNNSGEIEFIPDIVAMNNYRLGRINSL